MPESIHNFSPSRFLSLSYLYSDAGAPNTDPVWVERLSPGGSAEESKVIAVKDELLAVAGQNVYGMELDAINNLIWCTSSLCFARQLGLLNSSDTDVRESFKGWTVQ